ncbi:MAG: hypothetical protein E7G56_11225, partial [Staphylococcus epidermidis]|uniref:hypothetical protein n=3 Tax=Staphylococcus epidermidis TaxID=1282 RepID=UPI00066BFBDD
TVKPFLNHTHSAWFSLYNKEASNEFIKNSFTGYFARNYIPDSLNSKFIYITIRNRVWKVLQ